MTINHYNGKSHFRCYVGYSATGRQIEKTMTWNIPEGMTERKAEKEAQHQAALFEERVRNGQIADSRIKFQDFAEQWFTDYTEIQLRPTTVARYRSMMDRINPAIGHLYMDKIRPAHLMAFYKELSTTKISTKAHCKIDLKEHLKKEQITKETCAKNAGIALSVLSSIYQGKNIERSSAQKLSASLNKKYGDLFEDVDDGKLLSSKTIQHYHRLISSIMHSAAKWQIIISNPCDRVDPPKVAKVEIEYLDNVQAVHLLDLLKDAPIHYRCAIEVLLFTGMRRGELLGLEWPDIDFENQIINIHRSSLYLADRGIFEDDTKNNSSNRVIKVPLSAIKALRSMKAWQAQQKLSMGSLWKDSGKVFTSLDGSPMHPDTLSGWFHDFIQGTDLPPIHLHSLRHTNATLNIANGVSVTTVAGQLGHANASTTTKIYAHAIKSAQAAAADMMDDLLTHKQTRRSG